LRLLLLKNIIKNPIMTKAMIISTGIASLLDSRLVTVVARVLVVFGVELIEPFLIVVVADTMLVVISVELPGEPPEEPVGPPPPPIPVPPLPEFIVVDGELPEIVVVAFAEIVVVVLVVFITWAEVEFVDVLVSGSLLSVIDNLYV
jgi:hypothetical protein